MIITLTGIAGFLGGLFYFGWNKNEFPNYTQKMILAFSTIPVICIVLWLFKASLF